MTTPDFKSALNKTSEATKRTFQNLKRSIEPYRAPLLHLAASLGKAASVSPHVGRTFARATLGVGLAADAYKVYRQVKEASAGNPWHFWERVDICENFALLHPYMMTWTGKLGIEGREIVCRDAYRVIVHGTIAGRFEAYWPVACRSSDQEILATTPTNDVRVRKEDLQVIEEAIRDHFWADLGAEVVAADLKFVPDKPLTEDLVETDNLTKLRQRVLPFVGAGETRSFMLVGPPGSGKSQAARLCLAAKHGIKVMRLSAHSLDQMNEIASGTWAEYLSLGSLAKAARPDVLILEDLDHTSEHTQSGLLHTLEELRGPVPWLIATVNNPKKLKYALRRPERFDDVIDIGAAGAQEVLAILGFREPSIVGTWPIAYVQELNKRIQRMGIEPHSDEYRSEVDNLSARAQELYAAMVEED